MFALLLCAELLLSIKRLDSWKTNAETLSCDLLSVAGTPSCPGLSGSSVRRCSRLSLLAPFLLIPVSYTHLTLPTIYSV